MTKIAGSGYGTGSETGSISQRHGSADPDPHQNVMDPEHCLQAIFSFLDLDRIHMRNADPQTQIIRINPRIGVFNRAVKHHFKKCYILECSLAPGKPATDPWAILYFSSSTGSMPYIGPIHARVSHQARNSINDKLTMLTPKQNSSTKKIYL
jgi:hypothetical protein